MKPFLFSEEVITQTRLLQDCGKIVHFVFEKDFVSHFEYISQNPVSSGSVAQVYFAKLKFGPNVAIKIIKQTELRNVDKDFKILLFIAKVLSIFNKFKRLKLDAIILNCWDLLKMEIDLQNEARNTESIAVNLMFDFGVVVPRIFSHLSSSNILVSEWIFGNSVKNCSMLDDFQRRVLAKNILRTFLNQVYRDGVFHADLHHGNILFDKKSLNVGLVDFGIICHLGDFDRKALFSIIDLFFRKDYFLVAKTYIESGYGLPKTDAQLLAFANDIEKIASGMDNFIISEFLENLFNTMDTHNIEINEHLLLLYKSMIYIEQVLKTVDNNFPMWDMVRKWVKIFKVKKVVKSIFSFL